MAIHNLCIRNGDFCKDALVDEDVEPSGQPTTIDESESPSGQQNREHLRVLITR